MKALIIGGGIGGLTAAIALERVGIEAHVYERVSELTEVGAGSSLWANAVRALDLLGLSDSLRAPAAMNERQIRSILDEPMLSGDER